jgi:sigma-B regulation protein RsbQ
MLKQATLRNNVSVVGKIDGPVMMFAHGFGCDQDMWRRTVPAFVDDFRVVLFDHVGAGGSDPEAYDTDKYSTLDGYARDVVEICDELGLRDVTLVGHSVSAMVAIVAAVERPELFERLILVAPSPCYIDDADAGYVGGFTRPDIDGLLESLNSNYYAWAAAIAPMVMGAANAAGLGNELTNSFCRTNPDIAAEFAKVTFLSDSREVLERVTTPALILQCSDDMLAPVEVGRYLERHLARSRFVQLQATGHCPHVSAPDETTAAIKRYLDND